MDLHNASPAEPLHVSARDADSSTDGGPTPGTAAADAVLDNPAWSSLTGRHGHLAIGNELVRRFPDDVSPFVGVKDWDHPEVWDAILDVFGHEATVSVSHADPLLPDGWAPVFSIPGVQLVQTEHLETRPDEEAIELGEADATDMLELVERTRPGPFLPRTHELGRYVGIRRAGRLIAMAGERLHPEGWTEISAVAVDEEHRRQGLASRLVLDVAFGIQQRGEKALLHASATNTSAIAGYEKLGFALRRRLMFGAVRTP
ncbi:GNAT family N-acetyltransferase [Brachybacterium sacelli]|uniref:GNAT superfamily N-acetyltransferase n=1 Tax=Brachybacterium sacelli TaxID=173364 RepID=A0ABS4WWA6_9MICO|nr:GNAT family N-acetyltransferase [Brachybacterium sacelli]MBP2380477.1 GNAT superfamily N-acetyltransferase [Brachybacterium sacelli]